MTNVEFFVIFYMNLHTRSRSQAKKLWLRLRLQQKVAPTPAPQPATLAATLIFSIFKFKQKIGFGVIPELVCNLL
jgi:hypothetical protein